MKRILPRVLVLLLVVGGVAAAVLFARRPKDEDGAFSSSVVEGTEIDVASRVGGRLLEVLVDEGQEVEAGAVVARIDCASLERRREELVAQRERALAEARAAEALARGAGAQRSGAATQARAARARAEALEARQETAAREADRVAQVGEYATASLRDQSRSAADELALQARAAQGDAASLRAQVRAGSANAEAAAARAEGADHAVAALEATAAALELDLAECTLRAPRAGVVETRFREAGEMLAPGTPVVRLLDRTHLEATLYADAAALGTLPAGTRVHVRADSFPDETFDGRVTAVATRAVFTPRTIQTRSDRERLVYPVTITLEDPAGKLLPGMPVEIRGAAR